MSRGLSYVIVLTVLVSLVLVLWLNIEPQPAPPAVPAELAVEPALVTLDGQQESQGDRLAVFDLSALEPETIPPVFLLDALSLGGDLFDALADQASLAGWSDEELASAYAFWAALCGPATAQSGWMARQLRPLADNQRDAAETYCQSFPEGPAALAQEHDSEFFFYYRTGRFDADDIRQSLEDRLAPIEFERLIRQLHDALADYRFERVRDVVWALDAFDLFDHPSPEESRVLRSPLVERVSVDPLVLEAMATTLICRRLGGCRAAHPLVLRTCAISAWRPCLGVESLDDALSDTLTGIQLAEHRRLLRQIESGLAATRHSP